MKILLVVPAYLAYSYVNQGEALSKGFTLLNIQNEVFKANNGTELSSKLLDYKPDFVIGIGNWREFDLFVKIPKSLGFTCLPWIVVDEEKIDYLIDEYNEFGLIITPSRNCLEKLSKSGINKNIINVIPEAVDPDLWYPMKNDDLQPFLEYSSIPIVNSLSLNQWNLVKIHEEKIPVVYTAGGDATKKGAQEVIQALGQLDPKIPWIYIIKSWPVSIVFKKSIEELDLAEKIGILNRIRYISAEYSQVYMRALMNICDIYAAPSRIEGFGLPHVEAQMCAKPVISLATTATEETVAHGQTGFHAKRDFSETNFVKADINDLSSRLYTLITDHDLRQKMSLNAKTHALDNFSPKIIAQKFLDLISEI